MAGEPCSPTTNDTSHPACSAFPGTSNDPASIASTLDVRALNVLPSEETAQSKEGDECGSTSSFYFKGWTHINTPSTTSGTQLPSPSLSDTIEEKNEEGGGEEDDSPAPSLLASHLRKSILEAAERLDFKPKSKRKYSCSPTTPRKRQAPKKPAESAETVMYIQGSAPFAVMSSPVGKPDDNLTQPGKFNTVNVNASLDSVKLPASTLNQPTASCIQETRPRHAKGKGKEKEKDDDDLLDTDGSSDIEAVLAVEAELQAFQNTATAKPMAPTMHEAPTAKKNVPSLNQSLDGVGLGPAASEPSSSTTVGRPPVLPPSVNIVHALSPLSPLPANTATGTEPGTSMFTTDHRLLTFFRHGDLINHICTLESDSHDEQLPAQGKHIQLYALISWRAAMYPYHSNMPGMKTRSFGDLFYPNRNPYLTCWVTQDTKMYMLTMSDTSAAQPDMVPVLAVLKLVRRPEGAESAETFSTRCRYRRPKKAPQSPAMAALDKFDLEVVNVRETTWDVVKTLCEVPGPVLKKYNK